MKNYICIRLFVSLMSLLALAACSSSPDETYLDSQGAAALEIPPNLSQPVSNPEFEIPGISSQQTTYSGYSSAESQKTQVLPELGKDIKFKRDGNVFWLDINMTANKLWPVLKSFIGKAGFEIKYANKSTGIIDTGWRENEDGASFMVTLTSGEQGRYVDKYRLRLERGQKKGHTLLFIRHKGARIAPDVVNKELWGDEDGPIFIGEDSKKTLWIARQSDPELEIELLQNFMVYIGLDEDAVDEELSVYSSKKIAQIVEQKGGVALEVKENFPRTWRRIGLALDRMGFIVDDRNRSAGVYYISLPEKFETKQEKNWFERLFNKEQAELPHNFLLSVSKKGQKTHVTIRDRTSLTLDNKVAEKILRQIQAHIS